MLFSDDESNDDDNRGGDGGCVVNIKKYRGLRLLSPGTCNTQPLTLFSNIPYLELFIKLLSAVLLVVPLPPSLI